MGPYEETPSGNRYILVVTDLFTRLLEAFPLRNETAQATIQILEQEIFSRYGYPKAIISDNGTQFTAHIFKAACKRWKTMQWFTPIFHPRANPTERRNQEIKKVLRVLELVRPNQSWDTALHKGLFSIRNRMNAATGQTPSYLLFGSVQPYRSTKHMDRTRENNESARGQLLYRKTWQPRSHGTCRQHSTNSAQRRP